MDARRTDPRTREIAPSPYEATPTLTVRARRTWAQGLEVGLAYRWAGGTPYTPVTGVRWDAEEAEQVPVPGSLGRTVYLGVTTELPL